MTQRQGIYKDLLRAEMAVFLGAPRSDFPIWDLDPLPPFYRPTWDNYSPTSSLR
jgi:hypothetical protein